MLFIIHFFNYTQATIKSYMIQFCYNFNSRFKIFLRRCTYLKNKRILYIKSLFLKCKFRINGMMCNHCKANVERALAGIEGVRAVRVELQEGTAYLEGENIDPQKVISTINGIGYECSAEENL